MVPNATLKVYSGTHHNPNQLNNGEIHSLGPLLVYKVEISGQE